MGNAAHSNPTAPCRVETRGPAHRFKSLGRHSLLVFGIAAALRETHSRHSNQTNATPAPDGTSADHQVHAPPGSPVMCRDIKSCCGIFSPIPDTTSLYVVLSLSLYFTLTIHVHILTLTTTTYVLNTKLLLIRLGIELDVTHRRQLEARRLQSFRDEFSLHSPCSTSSNGVDPISAPIPAAASSESRQ